MFFGARCLPLDYRYSVTCVVPILISRIGWLYFAIVASFNHRKRCIWIDVFPLVYRSFVICFNVVATFKCIRTNERHTTNDAQFTSLKNFIKTKAGIPFPPFSVSDDKMRLLLILLTFLETYGFNF